MVVTKSQTQLSDWTTNTHYGLPRLLSGKESACQCRRHRRCGLHPCIRKIPWRRKWQTQSSILAWRIPWTEQPGGLQSMELQRVGHNWKVEHNGAIFHYIYVCTYVWVCVCVYNIYGWIIFQKGFPSGSVVKYLPANAADESLIPRSGRSPGEGNGNAL